MPSGRPNAVDSSPSKLDIIRDLLRGRAAHRIAKDTGVSESAILRYSKTRLQRYRAAGDPVIEAEQKDLQRQETKAVRDVVMEDVNRIRETGWSMLDAMTKPEKVKALDCDVRGAAGLLREIRGVSELQARLEGRLADKSSTQVNVVILSSHAGDRPEVQAQTQTPPALAGEVLDAEWSEISPGD